MFHLLHHPLGVKQMKRLKFRRLEVLPRENKGPRSIRLFIDETKSCSIASSGYSDGISVGSTQVQPG